MVLRAVKRRLRKAGLKVELRTLRIADYFDWLARERRSDNQESRAMFIGLQS
jgi:hypothetical protein